MRPPRPIPFSLAVQDLDARERLSIQCPRCKKVIGYQCYDVKLKLPGDYLVARYVGRHVCLECRERAIGFLETWPRSGAEGRG